MPDRGPAAPPVSPGLRSISRTKIARSSLVTKVGTPQTPGPEAAASCSLRTVASASPDSTASVTASTSAASRCRASTARTTSGSLSWRPSSWRAAKSARCTAGKRIGMAVPDDDAGPQRPQPGVVVGVLPDRRLALGDVHLRQRERDEGHLPVGPTRQCREHVLVGVAGEGAAVVAGDGECSARHELAQPVSRAGDSAGGRRPGSPRTGCRRREGATGAGPPARARLP